MKKGQRKNFFQLLHLSHLSLPSLSSLLSHLKRFYHFPSFFLLLSFFLIQPTGAWALGQFDFASSSLKIASFNVQVFGKTKIRKQGVLEMLKRIISNFDIVLIQEIRDNSGEAIQELLATLNDEQKYEDFLRGRVSGGKRYGLQLSERLGGSTSKEQYAYIYRTDKVYPVKSFQVREGYYGISRPPFAVQFANIESTLDFVLVGIHVAPLRVFEELSELANAFEGIKSQFRSERFLIMGDLNASCNYLSARRLYELKSNKLSNFYWDIGDQEDTTTSSNTSCAYDRFLANESFQRQVVVNSAKAFQFDKIYSLSEENAKSVSDHYPIQLELRVPSSSDGGRMPAAISN
jgi:endonuclease/exonuclease/phosphatase family metal-dependent hydrolase